MVAISSIDEGTEPSHLTREMRSLLDRQWQHLTGTQFDVSCAVEYNEESQRFEVSFAKKPAEEVRESLKSVGFWYNKWSWSWELYTWQVRLFEREEIGEYLSAISDGFLIAAPVPRSDVTRPWWKDIRDRQRESLDRLADAIQAERDSVDVGELVRFVHAFHNYSWNNMIYIKIQCPHASWVAGERKWNELGRFVKWGEKPIIILGPRFKTYTENERDPSTGIMVEKQVKKLAGFLALPVYDVSQTFGEPIPDIRMPSLSGDDAEKYLEAMKDFCREHKIEVDFKDLSDEVYRGKSKIGEIEVNDVDEINQQFATITHEVAHEYLHRVYERVTMSEDLKELEAEGVAHVVLDFLGLESTAPTYLAFYKEADAESIKKSAERILKTSQLIIHYMIEKTGWGSIPNPNIENE